MAKVAVSRSYQAPVSRVFEVFTDIANCAGRIPAIITIEPLTDQSFDVGYRWRETRLMFKKEATEEMWVTACEPNRRYFVEAESHGSHYTTEFIFTVEGEGTRVEMIFGAKPLSLFAKLMSPMAILFKPMIRKCFQEDMDALARVIDGEPGANVATT